ncbi:MAG: transcriptional regulator [Sphingomonadaceae bacterium]|nr:MAG: transcriptional regulator [Sphingomonadaceae bacterium]
MTHFTHPILDDVPLAAVLHALAEPARLKMVERLDADLKGGGEGLSCGEGACEGMPRATISNHFSVLRAAGLVEGRKQGVAVIHRLRREEVDKRFPGLLDAVLSASVAA